MSETMTASERRAQYERVMAAVTAGDYDALDDLLDAHVVDHNPIPDQPPGREGFKQWMRSVRAAFPDLTASVEDVVVEGDRLAARVRYTGTHDGDFVGLKATGDRVEFAAFHIVRFSGKTIAEWWGTADIFGVVTQLGARFTFA